MCVCVCGSVIRYGTFGHCHVYQAMDCWPDAIYKLYILNSVRIPLARDAIIAGSEGRLDGTFLFRVPVGAICPRATSIVSPCREAENPLQTSNLGGKRMKILLPKIAFCLYVCVCGCVMMMMMRLHRGQKKNAKPNPINTPSDHPTAIGPKAR